MRRQLVTLTALGAVLGAPSAVAAASAPQTIRVTSVTISMVGHDVKPKGPSAGDSVTYRDRLLNVTAQFGKKKGAVVGSDRGKLTYLTAHTATFTGRVMLPGGTLRLSGAVYGTAAGGLVVPILGGTGRYADARGTLTVGSGRDRVLNTYSFTIKRPVA
jgi:hypothetical protein